MIVLNEFHIQAQLFKYLLVVGLVEPAPVVTEDPGSQDFYARQGSVFHLHNYLLYCWQAAFRALWLSRSSPMYFTVKKQASAVKKDSIR